MIAYFDTSVLVSIGMKEAASETAARIWNRTSRPITRPLTYVEARAAIGRARRLNRLSPRQGSRAVKSISSIHQQVELVQITDNLVLRAGQIADDHGLRGYDAVHLTAALAVDNSALAFVTGDHGLATAAKDVGLAIANIHV